jgi:hypothetical protein
MIPRDVLAIFINQTLTGATVLFVSLKGPSPNNFAKGGTS